MVLIFGPTSGEYGYLQSLLFVSLLLPVLAGAAYLIIYYLVPKYLLQRRFVLFGLFTAYTFIVAAWVGEMIVMGMLMFLYENELQKINPRIHDIGFLTGMMFLVILPAITYHITRQWYNEREMNARLQQEKLELELFARQKELDYLREQMHPHFLFNALNNLYGLTLEKSDDAPELVLRLSELLDYMLYRSEQKRVPLTDEIRHINNYLEVQKIRCGDRLHLSMDIDTGLDRYRIAPMLLMPFLENSFKHGVSATSGLSYVSINLHIKDRHLHFGIINSLPAKLSEKKQHGVGLTNVGKRLELLYGDKYTLQTQETEKEYRVKLFIPLEGIQDEEVEMHDRG
ncbi:MAG TPA: histidine kinase [Balneolales bacterium]|nr:histidine kinase [Balneolales bacterium]